MTMQKMPAAFLGHGNPMNALARNKYTEAWRLFGEAVPRPTSILVISAHWYTNATAVTSMVKPRTIHDFYGFPQELFDVDYPAPGSPELAEKVADVCKPRWVGQDIEEGVLIVGSGNIVHNLRAVDFNQPDAAFDWAQRFDDVARERLTSAPHDVAALDGHPDWGKAVPTPDHYLPLLYIAGLADGEPLDPLVDGHAAGSISMAAYTLGMNAGAAPALADGPAADFPDGMDPIETNL